MQTFIRSETSEKKHQHERNLICVVYYYNRENFEREVN